MEWGQIVLYSKNVKHLALFLERLLDAEIDAEKTDVTIRHQDFTLCLKEKNVKATDNAMALELFLQSEDELKNMLQRAEFCQYGLEKEGVKLPTASWSRGKVEVIDPDGRVWTFLSKSKGRER